MNVKMKDLASQGGIDIKTGRIMAVVKREDTFRLQRLLFRTMKGNVLINVECLPDPEIEIENPKRGYNDVMLIMFKEGVNINERISRACNAVATSHFEVPADIMSALEETRMRLKDVNLAKDSTEKFIVNTLTDLVNGTKGNIRLQTIKYFIEKFKVLNSTLHHMVLSGSVYEGLCWCSVKDEQRIVSQLKLSSKTNRFVKIPIKPEYPMPPTAIRDNEFLETFQSIVSTYGIPSYREINPAYFTVITFPFMFGIMFGDVLHGCILLFMAIYLMWANKETMTITNSMLVYLWPYRYIILLLGIFSVYCGFIYNEAGALPLTMFETCFNRKDGFTCTYPFGFDSIWKTGSNELIYVNSYKMKLSVVIACFHLVLGIFLKGIDCIYKKRISDFFLEFIPELLFTLCVVGYLTFLIIYKWLVSWPESPPVPSILTTMIDTFLKPFEKPKDSILPDNTQYLLNTILLCNLWLNLRYCYCICRSASFW
jgi:V-type H+-transporting ATPase subunit a